MSSSLIILLEVTLVLGVTIGLAVWELVRLRRDRRPSTSSGRPETRADPPAEIPPHSH